MPWEKRDQAVAILLKARRSGDTELAAKARTSLRDGMRKRKGRRRRKRS